MEKTVTCNPKANRDRWPELAKLVDMVRTFDPTASVVNVTENGRLVAGKDLGFATDSEPAPKCKCGCIEPFCNCDSPIGRTYVPGVR
jgi:hypothetical protein